MTIIKNTTQLNFHQNLRINHGSEILQDVRHYEGLARKLARFRNHLRFSLHCKHNGVIPVSLRLRSTCESEQAKRILRRAERALLNTRITDIHRQIGFITRTRESVRQLLSEKLPSYTLNEVERLVTLTEWRENRDCRERQIRKFENLVNQKNSCNETGNNHDPVTDKWVKNVSQCKLSDTEMKVLKKGLNFAVSPDNIPVVDIITATESACRNLPKGDADQLQIEVVQVMKKNGKPSDSNISKEERTALSALQRDKNIIILPADKGRCTVVMDKTEYTEKCDNMLKDQATYKKLTHDPTTKYKKELADVLRDLQEKDKVLPKPLKMHLYPTTETPPKFYGLPKVHKPNMPLRPIVSSVGSITYNTAKHLAKILSPLVGKTEHHVKNSKHFASVIKDKTVGDDEMLVSYDVSALFTSVPVDKALTVIHERLLEDPTLSQRTTLQPQHVTKLLEVCLKCTYFVYNGTFYLQIHGAAMGSPASPIVCNLYMEQFEKLALSTAPHPPGWWFRYVDDTHTKQKIEFVDEFTEHINQIDPDIKFTIEKEENNKLAFLDTNTIRNQDGTFKTTVFRKATHTDQYLDFHSAHPNDHKLGIIRTLQQRAQVVTSEPEDLKSEIKHVNGALKKCHYPTEPLRKCQKVSQ